MTLAADFNGDGLLDVIANTYSSSADPESRLEYFVGLPNGRFVRDSSNDALFSKLRGHGENMLVADFNNDGAVDVFLPYYTKPGFNGRHTNADLYMPLLLNDGAAAHFVDVAAVDEVDAGGSHHFVDEAGSAAARSDIALCGADNRRKGGRETQPNLCTRQPEGLQAIDLNQDGRIDLYVLQAACL